jgi:uncharacterized protein YndB with AHSA1/START domain
MITQKETIYKTDLDNKKLRVEREFDAPLEKVWRAWTESSILDQWWAPRPWKAVTQSMDFREGGRWRYYMQGPEGERHYCFVEYEKIDPERSFTGTDAFCDEKGNISTEFPSMYWKCTFTKAGSGTKVNVEVSFDSIEDLNKIVEMGFKEGFAAAHTNLDAILSAAI